MALLLPSGCSRWAEQAPTTGRSPTLNASSPSGSLQEVPPPLGVQQLSDALGTLQPQLQINQPTSNSLLGAGPWSLELSIQDWPLVNDDDLGIGPHMVVQIDNTHPLRISEPADAGADPGTIKVTLPELTPGSHRVTAYLALPWGEAVKSPGAMAQIQLHRVAANPLSQPAPSSPLLIPVTATAAASGAPVMIDWLLCNAPLQGLRDGDGRWRLRVTVNNDSFLVDQNKPLWLKGFRKGSNSVVLELLDGLGDPLNPPFNSLVQEVVLADDKGLLPAWLRGRLSATDLALFQGRADKNDHTDPAAVTVEPERSTPVPPSATEAALDSPNNLEGASTIEQDQAETLEPPSVIDGGPQSQEVVAPPVTADGNPPQIKPAPEQGAPAPEEAPVQSPVASTSDLVQADGASLQP